MKRTQSRRSFLREVVAWGGGLAAAARAPGVFAEGPAPARPLGLPIGSQLYPHRVLLQEDHVRGLATLGEMGIEVVELCSPAGYEPFRWLGEYTPERLRRLLADAGLRAESCHFTLPELRADLEGRIAWAREVGLAQMAVASLNPGVQGSPTIDQLRAAIEEFSGFAERMAVAGLVAVIHNERFEHSMVEGRRAYDLIIESTDPRQVKFQFQCSAAASGLDPVEYLTRYPGRYQSLHLQDLATLTPAAGQSVQRPIGQGVLDWGAIFRAAGRNGIRNYFVEMNLELTRASVPYLRGLSV